MTVEQFMTLTDADILAMTQEQRTAIVIAAFKVLPQDAQDTAIEYVKQLAEKKGGATA